MNFRMLLLTLILTGFGSFAGYCGSDGIGPVPERLSESKLFLSYAELAADQSKAIAALALVDEAIEKDSRNVQAYLFKSELLAQAGSAKAQRENLEAGIEQTGDVRLLLHLARWFTIYGQQSEARRLLSTARERSPNNAIVRIDMCRSLALSENFHEAETECRRAADAVPNLSISREFLGQVYFYTSREGEALKTFREALDRSPESPYFLSTYFYGGLLEYRSGNIKKGCELMERSGTKGRPFSFDKCVQGQYEIKKHPFRPFFD